MKHANRNILELRTLPQLSRAICMPGDNDPVRLPTFPSIERTSMLAFNSTDTISVGPSAQPTVPLRGFLVKNSVFPCWLDAVAAQPYVWQMRWDAKSAGPNGPNSIAMTFQFDDVPRAAGGNAGPGLMTVPNSLVPKALPVGELGGVAWVMVPKGCFLNVFALNGGGNKVGDAKIELEVWYPGGDRSVNELNLVKTDAGAGQGWYGKGQLGSTCFVRPSVMATSELSAYVNAAIFVVTNSTGYLNYTTNALTFDQAGSKPVLLPAFVAPALSTSAIPFSNTRTPALSALFTNVTKALNKEGTVMAGRLNPAIENIYDFDTSTFTNLLPSEKYFYGLENGFYTYAALSDSADHFRDDIFTTLGASTPLPWLNLADLSLTNCFVFNDPDGTTNLAVNIDWHIEYRNTSVLWPSAISSVSLETVHQLQLVLLQTGFFFENNTHRPWLRALTSALSNMSPFIMPMVKGAVSALPGGSAAYMGLKGLYNGLAASKKVKGPKPTTLQTSVAPQRQKPRREKKVRVDMKKDKKKKK